MQPKTYGWFTSGIFPLVFQANLGGWVTKTVGSDPPGKGRQVIISVLFHAPKCRSLDGNLCGQRISNAEHAVTSKLKSPRDCANCYSNMPVTAGPPVPRALVAWVHLGKVFVKETVTFRSSIIHSFHVGKLFCNFDKFLLRFFCIQIIRPLQNKTSECLKRHVLSDHHLSFKS